MGEVPVLLLRRRLLLLLWLRMLSQHWRVCHVCASQARAACCGCCTSLGLPVGCAAGWVRDPAVRGSQRPAHALSPRPYPLQNLPSACPCPCLGTSLELTHSFKDQEPPFPQAHKWADSSWGCTSRSAPAGHLFDPACWPIW